MVASPPVTVVLIVVFTAAAGYCLTRCVIPGQRWRDRVEDVGHTVMCVAMAVMVAGLDLADRWGGWLTVFAVVAAYHLLRATVSDPATPAGRAARIAGTHHTV